MFGADYCVFCHLEMIFLGGTGCLLTLLFRMLNDIKRYKQIVSRSGQRFVGS